MSCGHDGCTCGPNDKTPEQHARGEHLPTVGERPSDEARCCGGNGHCNHHEAEARAGQRPPGS